MRVNWDKAYVQGGLFGFIGRKKRIEALKERDKRIKKIDGYNTSPNNFERLEFNGETKEGFSGGNSKDSNRREEIFYFKGGYYLAYDGGYPCDIIVAGMLESPSPERSAEGGCKIDIPKLKNIIGDPEDKASLERVVRGLGFRRPIRYCLPYIMI